MIPIRFHPEADAEMMSAAKFYETQQKDLGKRFLASVQDALNRIQVNPLLYLRNRRRHSSLSHDDVPFRRCFSDHAGSVRDHRGDAPAS